jgi:hypothetical protein
MAQLPQPNTDTEVYLAAVVERLDALLRLLQPAAAQQPGQDSTRSAQPRKRAAPKRAGSPKPSA